MAENGVGCRKLALKDVETGKLREAYGRDLRDTSRLYLTDQQSILIVRRTGA